MKDLTDPTNRDTVPAMLTPGEFVLNKEASEMYAPYIEQMNNHGLQLRQQKNMGGAIPQYNTGGLVDFLKEHEGYRDKAYQDQAGVWTIGYGRTRNPDGSPIKPNQTTNKKKEDSWLGKRAKTDRDATEAYGNKHGYDWNSNQLDALASFRYNIGNLDQLTDGGTRGTEEIVQMIPEYNKAGGQVSKGLQNRRQAELDLFHNAGGSDVPVMRRPPPQAGNPLPESYAGYSNEYQNSPQGQQSFDDAFASARAAQGAGGQFNWGGQQYTTDREDDGFNMGGRIPGYNIGGWLSSLFSPDEERQAELAGTADRFANLDAAKAQGAAMGNVPAMNDLPVPNSDESLLQGSSQAVDEAKGKLVPQFTGEFDENNQPIYENVLPEQAPTEFVPQAMPGQQVQGGMAVPQMQGYSGDYADVPPAAYNGMPGGPPQAAPVNAEEWDPRYDGGAGPEGFDPGALVNNALDNAGQDTYIEPETYTTPEGEYGGVAPAPMAIPEEPYEYASRRGTPEIVDDRSAEIAAANEDGTGRINEEPMNFAAASEKRDVSQVGAGHHPDGAAMNFAAAAEETKEARKGLSAEDKKGAASTAIAAVEEASTPEEIQESKAIVEKAGGVEVIETSGKEAAKAPGAVDSAKEDIKSAFGDLFDTKELVRAAVMYLGARATGMSGGQALAFAGRGYMGRIDAKEASTAKQRQDLIKSGNYSPQSIDAYMKSGSLQDLQSVSQPDEEVGGAPKTFYQPGGSKNIQARQVNRPGVGKIWVDAAGNRVPNTWHDDATRSTSSPEYAKRIQEWSGNSAAVFKEMQAAEVAALGDKGTKGMSITGLTPKLVGSQTAKWAIENGMDPASTDLLLQQAYQQAVSTAGGKKISDIRPYLDAQYIDSKVGDINLFKTAGGKAIEPSKVNEFITGLSNMAAQENPETFGDMSTTQFSSWLMGSDLAKDWKTNMTTEDKQRYAKQGAKSGMSGFMYWLNTDALN